MKNKLFTRRNLSYFVIFLLLDVIAIGIGMGVPFLPILLGFTVGWLIPAVYKELLQETRQLLRRSIVVSLLTSAFSMLLLAVIWGPSLAMLWDPAADYVNFGIPMLLYEPKASFIAWMVLMILISPLLQFLVTITMTVLRLAWFPPRVDSESADE